jgi:hypothetical protein
MKSNPYFRNCKGCVSLGEDEGDQVCCNLVTWHATEVPENPPCMTTPEDEETPEYKAYIESCRVMLRMMMGGAK